MVAVRPMLAHLGQVDIAHVIFHKMHIVALPICCHLRHNASTCGSSGETVHLQQRRIGAHHRG